MIKAQQLTASPGISVAAPLQGKEQAGNDAKHKGRADPVEDGEAEQDARLGWHVPSTQVAVDFASRVLAYLVSHRRRRTRTKDEENGADGDRAERQAVLLSVWILH